MSLHARSSLDQAMSKEFLVSFPEESTKQSAESPASLERQHYLHDAVCVGMVVNRAAFPRTPDKDQLEVLLV